MAYLLIKNPPVTKTKPPTAKSIGNKSVIVLVVPVKAWLVIVSCITGIATATIIIIPTITPIMPPTIDPLLPLIFNTFEK